MSVVVECTAIVHLYVYCSAVQCNAVQCSTVVEKKTKKDLKKQIVLLILFLAETGLGEEDSICPSALLFADIESKLRIHTS